MGFFSFLPPTPPNTPSGGSRCKHVVCTAVTRCMPLVQHSVCRPGLHIRQAQTWHYADLVQMASI